MDWEVRVVTPSNYIQNVRVNNCITREDAEAAARGMTGAREILNSNPKRYNDQPEEVVYETVENNHYIPYQVESDYSDYDSSSLDKLEEETLLPEVEAKAEEQIPLRLNEDFQVIQADFLEWAKTYS